ncbi:MAG: Rid family detoxifying hydrolase [Deltaproteobacteria bacterium]|jgi:2-iminobutanoate/2-iminopropanoate deaminase|nr:Rid family detoxifying hydrolase [Deltaproteobacteria bacterium]
MTQPIATTAAPAAIGPYSQGVKSGPFVFVSGQLPLDPSTGEMPPDVKGQVSRSLANVKAILEAAGTGLAKVVRVGVFLTDLKDFQEANEVYGEFFKAPYPARVTVEVSALPRGAKVEIDAVAEA